MLMLLRHMAMKRRNSYMPARTQHKWQTRRRASSVAALPPTRVLRNAARPIAARALLSSFFDIFCRRCRRGRAYERVAFDKGTAGSEYVMMRGGASACVII